MYNYNPRRNINQVNNTGSNNFLQNPKLKNVDPLKLKIIMEIQRKSQNRSMNELLPEIMKIHQELNRRNMAFTKEETAILLEAIEENLSPEEKKNFAMIKQFF